MGRNRRLSDLGVAALKPRSKRYVHPDPELPGHFIRVQPTGTKSFVAVVRDPTGRQRWVTIGTVGHLKIAEAREKARAAIGAVKAGISHAAPESFDVVAETWFVRHVQAKGLLSAQGVKRFIDRHLIPAWQGRDFRSIRRADVAVLLDQVEDQSGARTADYVLAIIRSIANWYASRTDDYVSPVVRGMRRTSPKQRARSRILNDDELRQVWRAAEENGVFGAFLRLCLLTGQRREKIAQMQWDDIAIDGTWHIPTKDREKGSGGELPLPPMAIDIIREQSRFVDNPYVLAGRGDGHIKGIANRKNQFDAKAKLTTPWVIHDLRRSARSLMARAGVRPDVAERVLGHAIRGVEGIYDRHSYLAEKADALKRLAALIETIVNPPTGNVVSLVAAQ
jgi:integrase